MIRYILAALALISAAATAQQIVTSPVRLVDNSPTTPGIIIANAKTTPSLKKGATVFECDGGPPWRYSVAVPCPAPAAPIVTAIAAARVTTACKDLGTNAQWTYASKGGTYGNACLTRAMDAVPLDGALNEPRVFQDITLASSRHFITQKGTAWKAFNNVTLQRFDVTAWKRGIFIRGGSRDWLIQDFRIKGSRVNTSPGDIPVGIAMGGATNIVIRRGEISGFQTVLADKKKYANADCISAERGDSFSATDIYAHDCTDGIIDTKATTYLDRIRAANAGHYSYRFWAIVNAGTLISENPGGAHIQIASATARVTIDKLIVIGPKAMIHVDSKGIGGEIMIKECDLAKWTGTSLLSGFSARAKITLGKGCVR
ncbi:MULTISPECIES: hypothetical protein [unclassified Sphingomonas]|uniref:hypothetical protein n=1 Tax=Sphingomonas sp. PvP015 TaxID=3156388 RepID=UPI003390BECD